MPYDLSYGYRPYSMQDRFRDPYAAWTPTPLLAGVFANDPGLAQSHYLGQFSRSGQEASSPGFLDWLERQLPTYYKGYQAKALTDPNYSWDQHMRSQNTYNDYMGSGFLSRALPTAARFTTFLPRR